MSSVTSSPDSSQVHYYQQALKDMQNQLDQETRRHRIDKEKEVENLEKAYKSAIKKREEDFHETVDDIKEAHAKSTNRQKENYQKALDDIKDQTYNARGISGGSRFEPTEADKLRNAVYELRSQLEEERDLHSKQRQKDMDRISGRHEEDLVKKGHEYSEAMQNVKKEANDVMTRERQKYESALNRMEEQQRNRHGDEKATQSAHARDLQRFQDTIKSMEDAHEKEFKKANKRHDRDLDRITNQQKEELLKREGQVRTAIQASKNSAKDDIHRINLTHKAKEAELKEQLQKAEQVPGDSVPYEVHKQQVDGLVDSARTQDDNWKRSFNALESGFSDRLHEIERKSGDRIDTLTRLQNEQMKNMEEKSRTQADFYTEMTKKKGAAYEQAVRDNNEKVRTDRMKLTDAYKQTVDKLNQDLRKSDDYHSRKTREMMYEKDRHYSDMIAEQNKENSKKTHELENEFKTQLNEVRHEKTLDEKRANERLEYLLNQSNKGRKEALDRQAKLFSETMERTKKSDRNEIEILQKELNKKETTTDVNEVSPATENAVRRSLTTEYEKKLQTEVDKNKVSSEQMQRKYTDQYRRAMEETDDKLTQFKRESAREKSQERSQYMDSIFETDYQRKTQLREKDLDYDREREHIIRTFGNMLERQKRTMEHSLEIVKADGEAKLASQRQEATYQAKMERRAFTARQNEIIREYEKKLADQRTEYEFKIDEIKAQAQLDVNTAERRGKSDLEAQAKEYEQRIAQLNAQSQERERYISQNFQNEIDRTKRSYELLSKKKS